MIHPDLLGSPEINDKYEVGRLRDRQIGGFGTTLSTRPT
jgi:hypothetical protein